MSQKRLLEVAQHDQQFGEVSPSNQHCRNLIDAFQKERQLHGLRNLFVA